MQRSQSRSSLSASFEALAVYFPCMNSLEEDDGGEGPGQVCVGTAGAPGHSRAGPGSAAAAAGKGQGAGRGAGWGHASDGEWLG